MSFSFSPQWEFHRQRIKLFQFQGSRFPVWMKDWLFGLVFEHNLGSPRMASHLLLWDFQSVLMTLMCTLFTQYCLVKLFMLLAEFVLLNSTIPLDSFNSFSLKTSHGICIFYQITYLWCSFLTNENTVFHMARLVFTFAPWTATQFILRSSHSSVL